MLTAKQQRFIEAYSGNATQAAIQAGYSAKTAYAIGQENLKKPEIQQAIHEREQARLDGLIANRDERLAFLTGVMRDAEHKTQDRLKACELLCRACGDFIDKSNVQVEKVYTVLDLMMSDD